MNIVFVGTLPPHPGGSAVMNWQLLRGLTRRGHRCRALAPITGDAGRNNGAEKCAGVEIVRFPVPYFAVSTERYADSYLAAEHVEVAPRLERLLEGERPDIMVIGRESFLFHTMETAAAHALPTLLVTHFGSLPASLLNRSFAPALGPRLLSRIRSVDRVISVAGHQCGAWKQLGLGAITLIPNAVDCSVFSPGTKDPALLRALGIPADAVVAVHVSNLKAGKRPFDLVRSARQALRRDSRLMYVIVGDGPCRSAMEEICRREAIAERFRYTGWVRHTAVAGYLNLADLVVMPSEEEGRCLACLEAQACGRTVLSSDIAAAREIITDGETGLLFRMGDVEDLADKTLRAAGDAELRRGIGSRARQAAERWSLDDVISAYESAMAEVVSARQAVRV